MFCPCSGAIGIGIVELVRSLSPTCTASRFFPICENSLILILMIVVSAFFTSSNRACIPFRTLVNNWSGSVVGHSASLKRAHFVDWPKLYESSSACALLVLVLTMVGLVAGFTHDMDV